MYDWIWDNFDFFSINASNNVFQVNFFFEIRLFKYFIVLIISSYILINIREKIRIILILIINTFFNCLILSFWVNVYETNRFVLIFRNFIKFSYSIFNVFSSFIRINRTICSYLIWIILRNFRIIDKASFFCEWV